MPIKPDSVDQYLDIGCGRCKLGGTLQCKVNTWSEELGLLREIIQQSGLIEQIKWSAPCYTHEGKNILMLSAYKESVIVSYFQGVLLTDPEQILELPGENSRHARYLRFSDLPTINARKPYILNYIKEAIKIAESGQRVNTSSADAMEYPEELIQIFEQNPEFEQAFTALTPGRQRGYVLHFSSAKQSQTRVNRIHKYMPKIFEGKGWNEQ